MDALTPFFDWLVAASVRASLLTVAVLIVQLLFRHRVPSGWLYALWLPVLIVLLMPAFPESRWSVGSIIQRAPAPLVEPSLAAPRGAFPDGVPVAAVDLKAPIDWRRTGVFAWLVGTVGVVLVGMAGYWQTRRQYRSCQVPVSDALRSEIDLLAREIGLRHAPRVWMASAIRSPAVTGLLRPILLLPAAFEQSLAPHEARLVLRHELTHIKRGDLLLNALLCLLLALHWFNPLLWLAFFKARLDREAACDGQVLDRARQDQRVAYGHTLLKVETTFRHHGLSLGFVGIFQRGIALRSRIQSIATQPNPHPLMKTALSLSMVLLTFLGITKAATLDAKAPQVLIEARFVEVAEGSKALPAPFDVAAKTPGVAGVLSGPEWQILLRRLSAAKGVDVLSAPKVTALSGQAAKIEIIREFAYADGSGKRATKNLGVTLGLLPTVKGDDRLDLVLSPQIVELEGYVKEQPVFSERKEKVNVVMTAGETIVLEMAPKAGRATATAPPIAKRLLVFATAHLIDPAKVTAPESPLQAKLDSIILPSVQFTNAPLVDAVPFLRAKSAELDPAKEGLNIVIKSAGEPTVKVTLDLKEVPLGQALKYVAELAGLHLVVGPHAVALLSQAEFEAHQKRVESGETTQADPVGGIILTQVEFQEATLSQAVDFLRAKTRALDPAKKGLNIVVKPGGDPNTKITLSLKNVPATEALRFCAELSGYTFAIEDGVLVLTPGKR